MSDYKLNPLPPIEIDKKELVNLVLKLNVIHDQIRDVQRSIPYGPGNIVIKKRLCKAKESLLELISYLVSEYLE
jgi:hypothetical protein